jgi:hypothetical protein
MCKIHQIILALNAIYRHYSHIPQQFSGFNVREIKMAFNTHIIKERNEYSVKQESGWKVDYGYKGYGFAVKRDDNSTVCNFPDGLRPEQKQLANLIANLPQILDALQDVTAFCAPLSAKGKDAHDNAKAILKLFK